VRLYRVEFSHSLGQNPPPGRAFRCLLSPGADVARERSRSAAVAPRVGSPLVSAAAEAGAFCGELTAPTATGAEVSPSNLTGAPSGGAGFVGGAGASRAPLKRHAHQRPSSHAAGPAAATARRTARVIFGRSHDMLASKRSHHHHPPPELREVWGRVVAAAYQLLAHRSQSEHDWW
jgi:hypothetical protein